MRASAQAGFAPVNYAVTRLGGGVTPQGVQYPGGFDQTTPSLSLQPGAVLAIQNFECAQTGGYSRIQGYERFDGLASPSAATYTVVQVASFTNTPSVGQVITQAGSGATGTIVAVGTGSSPYVAVTLVTGTFDYTGAITTPGPVDVGTAVTTTVQISSLLDAQYTAGAADAYRALIGAVPGSGGVLGVVAMAFSGVDNVYAFRANVGGTAVEIYKSSATGWTSVPLYNLVSFTVGGGFRTVGAGDAAQTIVAGQVEVVGGSLTVEAPGGITVEGSLTVSDIQPEPADGETLTQGAVTATIKRVMTQSGSWSGGTAVGQFVILTPTGGNFVSGIATASGGAAVMLSGAETAITLLPGGRFEFVKANFSGQLSTRRIYGCDGVNQCFEFDGDTLSPITTGLSPDVPSHITFHHDYLFVSQASSVVHSGPGEPFLWSSVDGGGEYATGDTVTAMMTMPGNQTTPTLAIYLRGNTSFLYGTGPSTFSLVPFNPGTGALPGSAQNLFDSFSMDDLGVVSLRATLNFGNFSSASLTKNILPFILQQRTKLVTSSTDRAKSQYRLFFNDGYGLWLTIVNQQYMGAGIVLFPNPVNCVATTETVNGGMASYFGSSDANGYVYQMDVGTSFDGTSISAYFTTAWDANKSPRVLKRYRAASMEMQSPSYVAISFGYQLGYGSPLIGQPTPVSALSNFRAAPFWDSFTWDSFVWDGQTLSPTDVDVTGTGENIQTTIASDTAYIGAYTVNSIIYHWSPRRGLRV